MNNNWYQISDKNSIPIYPGQTQPYAIQQPIQNQLNPYTMQPFQGQQCPFMMQSPMGSVETYGLGNVGHVNKLYNMGMMHLDDMDDIDFIDDYDDNSDMDFIEAKTTSDRPAVITDNPAVPTISLFKELSGYPNYGNPSGNADILYTGNRGVWTFQIPPIISALGNIKAELIIRAVLDDHYNVPVDRYSARITVNGAVVHTGRLPLEHGRPEGKQFNNWRLLTFTIPNLRRNNRVVIVNTSNTGNNDWVGFDWMEMRFLF